MPPGLNSDFELGSVGCLDSCSKGGRAATSYHVQVLEGRWLCFAGRSRGLPSAEPWKEKKNRRAEEGEKEEKKEEKRRKKQEEEEGGGEGKKKQEEGEEEEGWTSTVYRLLHPLSHNIFR